jgi:DtxR family Mn-dependent transcriptional regulator|tara:strand:- start:561 stop:1217 length:657 start_codon:yes stop_codon:yes gene_type:complete
MNSQTKENYLKSIYFLSKKNKEISLTELSDLMNVSKPTANNMIKKLTLIGWVSYEKYKPILLTDKGEKEASLIVRKHRLSEIFLSKIMGFGWEEVHDIAEDMEHLKSEKLFDRMNELLGFPKVDPHGSPIPNKSGEIYEEIYINFSKIEVGNNVRLCALENSSKELLVYLNNKNIRLGTELYIKDIESFDNSVIVNYEGYKSVTLSFDVIKNFLVEKI